MVGDGLRRLVMRGEKDLVVVSVEGERTYTWSLLLALYSPTMATMMADQGSGLGITLDNVTSQDIQQVVEALQQGSRLDTPAARALAIQPETKKRVINVNPTFLRQLKMRKEETVPNDDFIGDLNTSQCYRDIVENVHDKTSTNKEEENEKNKGSPYTRKSYPDCVENLYEKVATDRQEEEEEDMCEDDIDVKEEVIDNVVNYSRQLQETPKRRVTSGLDRSVIDKHDFKFIETTTNSRMVDGLKTPRGGRVTVNVYVDFKYQLYRSKIKDDGMMTFRCFRSQAGQGCPASLVAQHRISEVDGQPRYEVLKFSNEHNHPEMKEKVLIHYAKVKLKDRIAYNQAWRQQSMSEIYTDFKEQFAATLPAEQASSFLASFPSFDKLKLYMRRCKLSTQEGVEDIRAKKKPKLFKGGKGHRQETEPLLI